MISKHKIVSLIFILLGSMLPYVVQAASVTVPMYLAEDPSKNIGTITISTAKCGVLLTPQLHDLPPGVHGFHVHEKPTCADKAMAAGPHFDPKNMEKHEGPYQTHGHLGDMPVLIVDKNGIATLPMLAPNLTLKAFKGHALMIHAGADNYADTPEKLGGGGARIACGVISK